MGKVVVLRDTRIAFTKNLWTPGQYENSGPETRSAKFLFPAGDGNKKNVEAAIEEVARAEWPKNDLWKLKLEEFRMNIQKYPLMDGNRKPDWNGFPGNWSLTAKRAKKDGPVITTGRSLKDIVSEDSGVIYGGCYVNAKVDIWAQSGPNEGIRCTLQVVQFSKAGESFGGAPTATVDGLDDLGYDEDEDGGDLI